MERNEFRSSLDITQLWLKNLEDQLISALDMS